MPGISTCTEAPSFPFLCKSFKNFCYVSYFSCCLIVSEKYLHSFCCNLRLDHLDSESASFSVLSALSSVSASVESESESSLSSLMQSILLSSSYLSASLSTSPDSSSFLTSSHTRSFSSSLPFLNAHSGLARQGSHIYPCLSGKADIWQHRYQRQLHLQHRNQCS